MSLHDTDVLFRALKRGEVQPVYYLVGAEDVLKDESVRLIVDAALDPSLRDFNLDQRSAAQLDAEGLHALLNTPPMMADRRIVILRDVEGLKKKPRVRSVLDTYLSRPSADAVVVLVQGAGEEKVDADFLGRTFAVGCVPLQPERTLRWIALEAGRAQVEITPEAAAHLLSVIGNDLGALRMEVAKLAGLSRGGPVSLEQVASLVGVPRGGTIFDWREAILEGRTALAATLTARVLERSEVSGVKLVSLLGTTLVALGATRALHDRGQRGGALSGSAFKILLNTRPFGLGEWKAEVANLARWIPAWPLPRVRAALRATLAADQSLKGTRISDERGVLIDLVLQLADARQEAA